MATTFPSAERAPARSGEGDRPGRACGGRLGLIDFDDFFDTNYRSVVRIADVTGGRGVDGESVAQEAFVRALRRWDRVGTLDDPVGWVRRVCINLAIDEARRRNRRGPAWLRSVIEASPSSDEPSLSAESIVTDAEDDAELWAAVAGLPSRQRAVVSLFYIEDLSTAEIAEILDCRPSTVGSNLAKARANLARMLAPDGDAVSEHPRPVTP